MLTPRFELTQSDSEVVITVHAPYANIKDTEVYVDGTDFRFYSSPYYLRLKLPGEIEENDASSGSYDCEKGDFVLRFSKINPKKLQMRLDLVELETAAYSVHEEDLVIENAVHGMVEQVADLKIDENDKEKLRKHSSSSSDSSDTDSETESDSSSSSSSSSDSSLDSDDADVPE